MTKKRKLSPRGLRRSAACRPLGASEIPTVSWRPIVEQLPAHAGTALSSASVEPVGVALLVPFHTR